jgi:DNA-binding response OmpR family regulator
MTAQWSPAPLALVEDDPNDAFFVRHALKEAKIANPVVAFKSADEARRQCSGSPAAFGPVLFILDLHLVGESGLDFLRWLRAQAPPLGSTPAMILTGSDDPSHRGASRDLGALEFLQKPVTADRLATAVQALGFVIMTGLASGEMGARIIERRWDAGAR